MTATPTLPDDIVEILRSEVGSTLHGTAVEGQDDRDEMGVAVEHPRYVTGLSKFEQYEYRTAASRSTERGHSPRSGPGDLDLTVYGLRKWMRLATQGNPSILLPLFAPHDRLVTVSSYGNDLRSLAPAIVSKRAIPRFRGYMRAQVLRLCGEKGSGHGRRGGGRREEEIARHGFDAKFAMHALRLGYQGVELAETGRITVPMTGDAGDYCRLTRLGRIDPDDVVRKAVELDHRLADLEETSPLPDYPDYDMIEGWMREAYRDLWEEEGW